MKEKEFKITVNSLMGVNDWIDQLEKYVAAGHKLVELGLVNSKELNSPDMQNLVQSAQMGNIALYFAKGIRGDHPLPGQVASNGPQNSPAIM